MLPSPDPPGDADDGPVDEPLEESEGRLIIPASGTSIDDDLVRSLREAIQW